MQNKKGSRFSRSLDRQLKICNDFLERLQMMIYWIWCVTLPCHMTYFSTRPSTEWTWLAQDYWCLKNFLFFLDSHVTCLGRGWAAKAYVPVLLLPTYSNLSIIFIIIIIIQLEVGNSYRSPLLLLTKQLDLGRCKLNLLGKSKLAVMPEMLNRNWLSQRIQMTWRLTRIKHQHP